eukprot:1557549-Rhodomonas_salina.1
MTAVRLCLALLMRFKGKQDSSTSESNIWDQMNSMQALGMSRAGKKQININEVDLLLKEQFDSVAKVFTTVDEFTEHLLMCALIKIIKDGVNRPGAVRAAWKAANDRRILMQSKLTLAGAVANPLTMARISNAIELVQQHLDENPAEEIEEVTTAGTTALATEVSKQQHKKKSMLEQLKAEIAEHHRALTELQKTADGKAEGCGWGCGGGRGGCRGKSQGGFIPKGLGVHGGAVAARLSSQTNPAQSVVANTQAP